MALIDPPEVPYPSEQELDRAFWASMGEEEVFVPQSPRRFFERDCPWFYPDYVAMMAEVAEEEM